MIISKTAIDCTVTVLDTIAFFLVTIDLYGRERLSRLGERLRSLLPEDIVSHPNPTLLNIIVLASVTTMGVFISYFFISMMLRFLLSAILTLLTLFGSTFTMGLIDGYQNVRPFWRAVWSIAWFSGAGYCWYKFSRVLVATLTIPFYLLAKVILSHGAEGTFIGIGTVVFVVARAITFYSALSVG